MPLIFPTNLAELACLSLVFFGFTFLIKDSTLLQGVRELVSKVSFFERLLECSFCVGMWVGILIGACRLLLISSNPHLAQYAVIPTQVCAEVIILYGVMSAAISYLLDLLTRALEAYIYQED